MRNETNNRLCLQLFAGEDPGGDGGSAGAAAGETAAVVAGQQGRSDKNASSPASSRMRWEEIMADPEYNRQMQSVVQARLKSAKTAQENLQKLSPALTQLAKQHNMDPENMDYDALAAVLQGEDRHAAKPPQSAAPQEAEQANGAQAARQHFARHMESLHRQGEALKKTFPQFDLRRELRNPAFAKMTAPHVGISVADAYYAVHRSEIQTAAMQVTAQKAAQKLSNAIQAGQHRPTENGTAGQAASVVTFDYRSASREQRDALKKRIIEAAAQGRKLYPGD